VTPFIQKFLLVLLLLDGVSQWAMIIENKIWSTEHHDQLNRRYQFVKGNRLTWNVIGVYLTPFGDRPSHEKYLSLDYRVVCKIIDSVTTHQDLTLSSEVRMSVDQYAQMVRRHIVGDSEITRLCRQIYQKHKVALDLIYEHRPNIQAQIRPMVDGLIREHPRLELDKNRRDNHKFGVTAWDTPALLSAQGWTKSGRILLFVFHNYPSSLDLQLFIGPGPEATRYRLLAMVRTNPEIFVMPINLSGRFLKSETWIWESVETDPV
jgi:PD-(D/E)XK nuclease superfamily